MTHPPVPGMAGMAGIAGMVPPSSVHMMTPNRNMGMGMDMAWHGHAGCWDVFTAQYAT